MNIQFLHSVYSQLCDSQAISRFKQQTDNSEFTKTNQGNIIWKILPGWLREAVDDPDEVFKRIILFPLLECEVQHKVVIMFVDGLDLDVIIPGSAATGQTLIINQIIAINY